MKPRRPPLHLTPLERMFQFHKRSCSYYRFSDGPKRLTQCSCGRNEAEQQYRRLMEQVKAMTLWPMDEQKG
jgi:hypothetical protein